MSGPLKALRDRIDALDQELLKLLSERADLARDIGRIKDGAVYRPEREAQVLRRLREMNGGPLSNEALERLFVEIISMCRALEQPLAVAYLGPSGTFSEEAAVKRFGSSTRLVPSASIDEVFHAVEARQADYGVVPVENSTEGAVGRALDLLLATPLKVCGEIMLPVHQTLLFNGEALSEVKKIYSHPQSFAQCQQWLNANLPVVERINVSSNGEAARLAAGEAGAAAIGGRRAGETFGVRIAAQNIEDDPRNTTRFLVIGQQDVKPSGMDKTSLVMSAQNKPGAVHQLLTPLATHGVSMSRLESRPSRAGLWEYVFFVDLEGHRDEPAVAAALKDLAQKASFLKILGSYPAARG